MELKLLLFRFNKILILAYMNKPYSRNTYIVIRLLNVRKYYFRPRDDNIKIMPSQNTLS